MSKWQALKDVMNNPTQKMGGQNRGFEGANCTTNISARAENAEQSFTILLDL